MFEIGSQLVKGVFIFFGNFILLLDYYDMFIIIWYCYGYMEGVFCIFDLLDKYKIKIIFYMFGCMVEMYLDWVKEIV